MTMKTTARAAAAGCAMFRRAAATTTLWALCGLAAAAGAPEGAPAGARPEAIQAIIDRNVVRDGVWTMKLSPDGRHLAMITWTTANTSAKNAHGQFAWLNSLLLEDVATNAVTPVLVPDPNVVGFELVKSQAESITWIADDLFAVGTSDGSVRVFGLDGKERRRFRGRLIRVLPPVDGRDPVAIVTVAELLDNQSLRRIDLRTGEDTKVPTDLPGVIRSVVFDARGRVRSAVTTETDWLKPGARITSWYRHDEASPWRQLLQKGALEDGWWVVAVPGDSDEVVIRSREDRDTWALFGYDAASGKKTDLSITHPTDDVQSFALEGRADVQGVVSEGLKRTVTWLDPAWQRLQKAVDKALPGAYNQLSGDPHGAVLIESRSDRDPGRWLVLDVPHMHMRTVGHRLLDYDASVARPMETLTYAAPDGLAIPAYLTRPAGTEAPRPMVVLIHGGPVARDRWEWNDEVQILAEAGYAVFQPQFRGSTGFGKAFEVAGYRQWGLAMQDDITAGVKEMARRGVADPGRVCIVGSSYGGYAALWGLAKTPELYRCGVSFAGPSDIGEMFTDRSDINDSKVGPELRRFYIGDIDTMRAQFDEVSPEKHADRIHAPVLLFHGRYDWRVPIGHSLRMKDALEKLDRPVEYHAFSNSGHGLAYAADQRERFTRTLDFLDRQIGPSSPYADRWAAPPMAPASAASAP